MNPVAIFRHFPIEGPGYFATFLELHGIPWQLIRIDAGDAVPSDISAFSGLAFMGGPMSVNDELPWIAPVLALIRAAQVADMPVLGHCLGGQLMAKALGGTVSRNPVKEIGWGEVRVEAASALRVVDIIGDESLLPWVTHALQDILENEGIEYLDLVSYGIDDGMLQHASLSKVDLTGDQIVNPNYFQPFTQKNIPIHFCVEGQISPNLRLFKADGDQDRPN